MAAERTVYVKVGAKVEGAVAGLRKVKAGVDDLTKADIKKPQKAFDDLANKGALMGGVVALGIGKAISSFANFDAAMSGVAANSAATGAQLDALRQQALDLGAATQFSATEAAQGINELAKAGVSSAEILNGGLKGALDLAAAGQIGVAEAAETTASALNQFGLKGDKATHVADLLANAANAAQGGVGDMGAALGQAGVAAKAAGLNIDETTTLLALFAKAGMTGSDAGTSLKTMLQRLAAPTEKAAETLKELGISAYDSQGNFVGAQKLLGQLSSATKDMSTQARAAAFNVIFGTDAIRAASIAAAAGADGYATMTKEVTKAGGAAENAAKLTDNLKGDIERLGGSIETAFISSGSAANGALRTLVGGLEGVVDSVSKVPAPLLLAGAALGGLALALPKGISVYRNFADSMDTMGLSMDKVSKKAPKLGIALRGLQGVAAGLTIAAIAGTITNALVELADVNFDPQSIADGTVTLDKFNKKMRETSDLGAPLRGTLEDFGQVIEATFNAGAGQEIDSFFAKINSNFGVENVSDIEVASQRFEQMDNVLSALVAGGKGDAAKAMFDQITTAAALQGVSVDEIKAKLPEYAQALVDVGRASTDAAPQIGETSEAVKDVEKQADDAKKALDALTETIEGFGSPLAAQRAAQRDYKDAILGAKDALKAQREELIKTRTADVEKGLGKVSTGPTVAATNAVTSAKLRLTQAEQRLQVVQAKGVKATAKELLSARQAVERAELSVKNARDRAASSGSTKDAELTDKQKKAIEDWADAQIKAGAALNTNTEAGLKNQAALDGIRTATLKAAVETFKLTGSQKLTADQVNAGRRAFVQQAIDFGLNADKAEELANNMGLIPKDVLTQIALSGVPTANTQLDVVTGKLTKLDDTTAKPKITPKLNGALLDVAEVRLNQLARTRTALIVPTFTNVKGVSPGDFVGGRGGTGPGFATGGFTGVGGRHEPAGIVHKGEVVFEQPVVQREGVDKLLALRAGKARIVPGYAGGGYVGMPAYRQAPPPPFRVDLSSLAQRQGGDTFYVTAGNPEQAARRVADERAWRDVNG